MTLSREDIRKAAAAATLSEEAVERIYGGHALAWAVEPRGITAYPVGEEPVVITLHD